MNPMDFSREASPKYEKANGIVYYIVLVFAIYIIGLKFTWHLFLIARKSINRSSTEKVHKTSTRNFCEPFCELLKMPKTTVYVLILAIVSAKWGLAPATLRRIFCPIPQRPSSSTFSLGSLGWHSTSLWHSGRIGWNPSGLACGSASLVGSSPMKRFPARDREGLQH